MELKNFKIPKLKFNKMKMKNLENVLNEIDYDITEIKSVEKRDVPYEDRTHYKTVKEAFLKSLEKYANRPCILEKPSHKEPYKTITYKEFGEDVFALGTALNNVLNLRDKRVVIVGETQYDWYVSYMAMLCRSWNSCTSG